MSDIIAQFRHAARALLARRSFAIAAILTLAIGIGMTTSIFSVLYGVVLRPLESLRRLLCRERSPASSRACRLTTRRVSS